MVRHPLKVILTSIDPAHVNVWKKFCGDLNCVEIVEDSILNLSCDAIVSPANSFGFMDGGIDALYTERWGRSIQDRLQKLIQEKHHGELLVGTAEIVETSDPTKPFLIAAPTMRVPMKLDPDTVNPYLCARAVFLLIESGIFAEGEHAGERIAGHVQSVAFPGLGTGVGRVSFSVCARQVRAAIEECLVQRSSFPGTWAEASERHQLLYTDRLRRLQH
jgi:O-acetyl-ADP-ribose deacetylase (regulator of RNase III)